MAKDKWTVAEMPSQQGKVAIVTGANSGLGFWTALALARKGATVVMTCRTLSKGEAARDKIMAQAPTAALAVMALDLADLSAVSAFVKAYKQNYTRLDLLINNAGVMNTPQRTTADGFELQFGTNHLGHFALTGLLLDLLLKTPQSRIVTVSSGMHHSGKIDFADLMGEASYTGWGAYGQSKLANLLFAYELQRRLEKTATATISVAAHPGYSATNLQQAGPNMSGSRVQAMAMSILNKVVAQSAERGALPQLYAATAPVVKGGDYYGPDGFREMRGYPTKAESSPASHDQAVAQQLWDVSEKLTGVTYEQI
jgi:NAD(P)-dependent dehydrogenase (short-subunit alcohol dehydrogenase family)